ncbi:sigma-54 interaction domain-containing protein [Anaerovorax odorimutans]|uniref:sigma-54 interaction domain-containing protein n=1 Tax=Anaerovorax odorimutans TaxID=109327 RepID=UPI000419FBBB|nr:sigma 54-interacting transcriptional regulator [Anaerovorax odorimutans]
MYKLTDKDIEMYLESIPGVVVIDMTGIVVYVNEQCAGYFAKERDFILGKHILEIFPGSKMIEGLNRDDIGLEFYSSYLGIGITIQVPLFKDGQKIGLLEYDATQESQFLYELSDSYNRFLDRELKNLTKQIVKLEGTKYSIHNIAGSSKPIMKLKESIISAAKTNSTVMITGETGTGKELVAHAIHNLSSRRKNRMIKVNSSAIPENLVESELFGYEKGTFTGAVKEGKKGKFELANNGTLFIDEINQMPMSVQPKLLRVLQEKEVDRIGSDTSIPIDVRIIVAANQDLRNLVNSGMFREDLFYRLNVIEIKIPPLRDRLEDLEELIQSILEDLNESLGLSVTGVDKSAIELLRTYHWPGNVRELHNAVERAMNYTSGPLLTAEDFDFDMVKEGKELIEYVEDNNSDNPIEQVKRKAERDLIITSLRKFNYNKTKTAKYLNISRPLLYQKMKRLEI